MVDSIPEKGISLTAIAEKRAEEPLKRSPVNHTAAVYLNSKEAWKNYEDVRLAEMETQIREWIAKMAENKTWNRSYRKRRYTFSMLFELLTGEKYDQKKHAKYTHALSDLFAYYSSRIQKSASINGKQYNKKIYCISPRRLERMPYSLRLRIPWLIEHGVTIDARTMKPNPDPLEPGHARNPRTEANMERRREEARERYNERYKYRQH